MPAYDAILFDFDGTLADTEPLHYRCWNETLKPFGIDIPWDTYVNEFIGVPDRLLLARFCSHAKPPVELQTLVDQYPNKKDRFRAMASKELPFFPGCDDFLKGLGEYKLAVVTSSGKAEIEPILHSAGLLQHFQTVVYGGDVRNQKPSPEPYLLAADRLKAKHPLVIEDSDAGVKSAQAAGFDVIRIKSPGEVPEAVQTRLKA